VKLSILAEVSWELLATSTWLCDISRGSEKTAWCC